MNFSVYQGLRVLEVMHNAVKYHDAVQALIQASIPDGLTPLLELGAGDGAFVKRFESRGFTVDCVEIDDGLRAALEGRKVFATLHDVPEASYDFVYTVNVLEHISDLRSEILGVRRVLKSRGIFFVFVPAFNVLWTSLDDEVGHVQRFRKQQLKNILTDAGFSIRRLHYFDSVGFAATLVVKVLERMKMFSFNSDTVTFYDRYIFPLSRAMDRVFEPVIGKNLIAIAQRA